MARLQSQRSGSERWASKNKVKIDKRNWNRENKDDACGKVGFVNSTTKMTGENSTKIISGFEHLIFVLPNF